MAITQLNTADFDYQMMLNVINKSYKGKADITLSEYDTTAEPEVKVGSVFDNNGAIFLVDTSDITPTGYGAVSNSTTFYLYYDESAGAFIYATSIPAWSDARQGWYSGDDRALFSMYKDSGGTLYELKTRLIPLGSPRPLFWSDVVDDVDVNLPELEVGQIGYANIRIINIGIIKKQVKLPNVGTSYYNYTAQEHDNSGGNEDAKSGNNVVGDTVVTNGTTTGNALIAVTYQRVV